MWSEHVSAVAHLFESGCQVVVRHILVAPAVPRALPRRDWSAVAPRLSKPLHRDLCAAQHAPALPELCQVGSDPPRITPLYRIHTHVPVRI
jgi:hypothetical protein